MTKIDFIRQEFEKEGYTLLSKIYKSTQKLEFICLNNHKHEISWSNWKSGKRCGHCYGRYITIAYIKKEFKKENYTLLTKTYKNAYQYLDFICPNGHQHQIIWNAWQNGKRCGKCTDRYNITIELIKESFKKENYTLLTKTYKNNHQYLDFICPNGHKHSIKWNSWQQNIRCGKCTDRYNITIEFIKEAFEKENYLLLTTHYTNSRKYLDFICPNGHQHQITWNAWQRGVRCGYCPKTISKESIDVFTLLKNVINLTTENDNNSELLNIDTFKFDALVPEHKLFIDYDGSYWHKDTEERDKRKSLKAIEHGYIPVRIRQTPLEKITDYDVIVPKKFDANVYTDIIKEHIIKLTTKLQNCRTTLLLMLFCS